MGDVVSAAVRFRPAREREDAPLAPPPHDLEAERATLSACLLDGSPREDGKPNACDVVAEVLGAEGAAAFFDPSNSRVYEAIRDVRSDGTPVDLTTVVGPLRRFSPPSGVESWAVYLGTLADASPAIGNVEHHARLVLERWEDRQLIAALRAPTPRLERAVGDEVFPLNNISKPRVFKL